METSRTSTRLIESNLNPESAPFEPSKIVFSGNQFDSTVDFLEDSSNNELGKENSPSAVVPPNKFEENSFRQDKNEEISRESEVPRNDRPTDEFEFADR